MKIVRNVVIILIIVIVALIFARNFIIKNAARQAIRRTTGFDIEMGSVHAGIFVPVFEITDTRLINPEDFPERLAIEIATLRVAYDLPSVFSDEVHLQEVTIDIPRAVLIIREDGQTNLERLGKPREETAETPTDAGEDQPAEEDKEQPEPARQFRIDELTLRLGTIEVHQYEKGSREPEVQTYEVDFDRTAKDVTSFDIVNGMITAAVLEAVGTRAIQGFSDAFSNSDGDLNKLGDELEKTAKDLGKSLKSVFGSDD